MKSEPVLKDQITIDTPYTHIGFGITNVMVLQFQERLILHG